MDLRTYLGALRKSWWLIVLITLLGLGAALAAYLLTPKTYASQVTFYVSTPIADGSNPLSSGQFAVTRVNSYVELLSSEKLAREAAAAAGVEVPPAELVDMIEGSAELNTVLVTATVDAARPDQAFALAEAVSETFPEMVDELDNQGKSGSAVVVLTTVSGPTAPLVIAPSARLYLPIGLAAGLALGVVAALLRESLNTSIRSSEGLSAVLGAPALGTIHFDPATRRSPLIIGDQAASIRSESYRHLRTSLQFVDAADAAKVLLITSAVPDEGKTTTSVNLALSFAEFGDRVLLICGDLRRPKLGSLLELSEQHGLTGVLVGRTDLSQAIQQYGSHSLYYLGAGALPPNPSELLGGERMAALINDLRPRFDKIIIDAPPLLPVTDAAVASKLADGVVLVVRNGHTTRTQLGAARQTLEGVNARIIGGVLNMRKASRGEQRQYGGDAYQLATFEARRRTATEERLRTVPDEEPAEPAPPGDLRSPVPQQPVPQQLAPQQSAPQPSVPRPPVPQPSMPQQPVSQQSGPQQPGAQPSDPQQPGSQPGVPQQRFPESVSDQSATEQTRPQPAVRPSAPQRTGGASRSPDRTVAWESMPPDSVSRPAGPEGTALRSAAVEGAARKPGVPRPAPVSRGPIRRPSR